MPRKKTPTARGRAPDDAAPVEIDDGGLEELASLGCTHAEAAAWFGVTEAAFRKRLHEPRLGAVWRRGKGIGRVRLRRAQFSLAEKNTTMAVALGRRMLGQRDVADPDAGGGVTIIVDTGIRRGADKEPDEES